MSKLLQSYGEIKNMSRTLSELRKFIKELSGLSDNKVIQLINKSCADKNVVRYFTITYQEMDEFESGKEVMWVDTGYSDIIGSPVYIQFTMSDYWTGALVGTETFILQSQLEYRRGKGDIKTCEYIEGKLKSLGYTIDFESSDSDESSDKNMESVSQDKEKDSKDFISMLFERLMIPNSWNEKALSGYINSCIGRINSQLKAGVDCTGFLIFNEENKRVIFNSGLLDRYGKPILIVAYVGTDSNSAMQLMYYSLSFCESKIFMLTTLGFSKSDLVRKIERVEFCDSPLNLMFADGIDDFDLDCRARLEHCVNERIDRFPEEYRTLPQDVLCSDLIKAVEVGVELNKCDRSYIKPFYNRSRDSIEFIIPYHIMGNFQKKPELGIVISYFDGYWQIMTILTREDVMNDIKLFNMYEDETF